MTRISGIWFPTLWEHMDLYIYYVVAGVLGPIRTCCCRGQCRAGMGQKKISPYGPPPAYDPIGPPPVSDPAPAPAPTPETNRSTGSPRGGVIMAAQSQHDPATRDHPRHNSRTGSSSHAIETSLRSTPEQLTRKSKRKTTKKKKKKIGPPPDYDPTPLLQEPPTSTSASSRESMNPLVQTSPSLNSSPLRPERKAAHFDPFENTNRCEQSLHEP